MDTIPVLRRFEPSKLEHGYYIPPYIRVDHGDGTWTLFPFYIVSNHLRWNMDTIPVQWRFEPCKMDLDAIKALKLK